jgi:hypothetical protein
LRRNGGRLTEENNVEPTQNDAHRSQRAGGAGGLRSLEVVDVLANGDWVVALVSLDHQAVAAA